MNVAQIALEIALRAKPSWTGTGTSTVGSATVVDATLARSGESFAGGTLWDLGTTLRLFTVKSHTNTTIVLDTNITTTAISKYIVSTLSFADLLRIINSALSFEQEMVNESIAIDAVNIPDRYTLTNALDIRRVVIKYDDGTEARSHTWREEPGALYFYANAPSEDGDILVWYPANITIKTAGTDLLPTDLRKENFIVNCLQLLYRSSIQKMGKDMPTNYDLINELKDLGDRIQMKHLSKATTPWDYDPRFRA